MQAVVKDMLGFWFTHGSVRGEGETPSLYSTSVLLNTKICQKLHVLHKKLAESKYNL